MEKNHEKNLVLIRIKDLICHKMLKFGEIYIKKGKCSIDINKDDSKQILLSSKYSLNKCLNGYIKSFMKVKFISFMLQKKHKGSLQEYFKDFKISNRVNFKILFEKFLMLNQLMMRNL